jgi:hypothetical protein
MSIAALSGHITLSPGFEWLGTWSALFAFSTATVFEVCAYYIPWLDNFMDSLTTPAAVVAGTIMTAAMVGDMSPFLKWSLAVIAGGGVSAVVQGGTVVVRAGSSATTGGGANGVVSTTEMVGAILLTVFAFTLPIICLVAVIWIFYKMLKTLARSSLIKKCFMRDPNYSGAKDNVPTA